MSRVIRAIAAVAMALPAVGAAQTCTPITSLPAVISEWGSYCLDRSHVVDIRDGAAITIEADDVSLDCRGHVIDGRLPEGVATRARGIGAVSRKNISVRNCSVRGFASGINFSISGYIPHKLVVEDNRVDGSKQSGISIGGSYASFKGRGAVWRNIVTNVGGSDTPFAVGISTQWNPDVIDNLVDGVTSGGDLAVGISQTTAGGSVVSGNHIRNVSSAGSAFGIVVGNDNYLTSVEVRDNVIANSAPGPNATAIACGSNGPHIVIDNLATGYSRVLGDCVDAGGNRGALD